MPSGSASVWFLFTHLSHFNCPSSTNRNDQQSRRTEDEDGKCQTWCSHCSNVMQLLFFFLTPTLTFCLVTLFLNYSAKSEPTKMAWSWEGDKKKKRNPPLGFCRRKTLTHYFHSASLARLIHLFLLTPLSSLTLCHPPPLTPGLLFCRSSSFSFHLAASESLMPTMSWSVWMWAAFRMIIPARCVRLISPRCRTRAADGPLWTEFAIKLCECGST